MKTQTFLPVSEIAKNPVVITDSILYTCAIYTAFILEFNKALSTDLLITERALITSQLLINIIKNRNNYNENNGGSSRSAI